MSDTDGPINNQATGASPTLTGQQQQPTDTDNNGPLTLEQVTCMLQAQQGMQQLHQLIQLQQQQIVQQQQLDQLQQPSTQQQPTQPQLTPPQPRPQHVQHRRGGVPQAAPVPVPVCQAVLPVDPPVTRYTRERQIARPDSLHPDNDPLEWLSHYGRIARGNNWIDAAKLDAVGAFMEGTALTWFENNHRNWDTLEAFEQAFLVKYHTEAKKHQAREKLLAYRQTDETVDDVIANLDRLFRTADVDDDKTKKTTLLRALNRDVALAVLRKAPDTYEQMCQHAEEEAQAQASIDAHRPPRTRLTDDSTTRMDDLSKQIATLTLGVLETSETMTKLVEGVLRNKNNDQRENHRGSRDVRHDSNRNNIRDEFRNRDREYRTRDQGRAIRCYRCGELGHYANECMSERPQRQEMERPSDRNGPVGRNARAQERPVRDMETHYLDLLETHYLDLERSDAEDEEDDEVYAAATTTTRKPTKLYVRLQKPVIDEHRALDKGIREIRDNYMDVVPGSIGVVPRPGREETVDNAVTTAQPATSTSGPHRVDHPRIEARKPLPIELMQGLPELIMKEVLSNTTVPVSLAHLLYYAPSLRHECTALFKRSAEPSHEVQALEETGSSVTINSTDPHSTVTDLWHSRLLQRPNLHPLINGAALLRPKKKLSDPARNRDPSPKVPRTTSMLTNSLAP
ncbi:MAG: hypothetical protein J3Q66DRAFT_353197 [Benniella sp.]|nr:MAG: hypothetical protein J3Q66DRAFT_353197 [Benniella sp.]